MASIKSFFVFLSLVILVGCRPGSPDNRNDRSQGAAKGSITGRFSISGAYALYPLVNKWAGDFMKINPGVTIDISVEGTGQGIEDLMSRKCHLAMISRPLSDEEISAGLWSVPVAKDGVAPIVNQNNPYLENLLSQGLSPDELIKAFSSDGPLTWGELLGIKGEDNISVFVRADESGASDVFADFLFLKPNELEGNRITGDSEMIKSVQDNKFALGFCNLSYAFDPVTFERVKDIQVIPSDLDFDNIIDRKEIPFNNLEKAHRSIWLGLYPKNLCRELTIGSLGKPSEEAVIEFIKYILTDGQNDIQATGLCKLNDVYVRYGLEKLN